MSFLRADEVRALVAAQVGEVADLVEMAEPYWQARRARSPVDHGFVVGLGRSQSVNNRQRPSEGAQSNTVVKVLVVLQLKHKEHLTSEDDIGTIRDAIAKKLVAYQNDGVAIVWVEDAEVASTENHVWFESSFLAVHQKPLE